MSSNVSVLCIVGKGRSGSTILGDVLGSVDGIFHAGELWRLWTEGLDEKHTCSCGESVRVCAVWRDVLHLISQTDEGRNALHNPQSTVSRITSLFSFGGVARSSLRPAKHRADAASLRRLMGIVYRAIGDVTRSELVVDTSKWPLDPVLMSPPDGVDSYGIHLIRDPRDVAQSWQTVKHFPDTGEPMPTYGGIHTSASWTARNLAAEWAGKRISTRMLRLRYEDFASSPHETVVEILQHVGFRGDASSLIRDDNWVDLEPGHTIMGNPSRFKSGSIQIQRPARSDQPQRTVGILTYPLRRRYRYTS